MSLLQEISSKAREANLRFLVIGGYAISAHGYSRTTEDLDLLICKSERTSWKELILLLGFTIYHEQEAFMQFAPPEKWLPVDLMTVGDSTFEGLFADSKIFSFENVSMRIPSLDHLLALKFHALKQSLPHRMFGDLSDILNLIEVNRVDVSTEKFRQLCEKYGNVELYGKILRAIRGEFPE